MATNRKKQHRTRHLVTRYLERTSGGVFSDFSRQLTDLVGREHGVYALYKGNRLYYVGLASDLRNRIKNHLKDRHAGKWDKFSLYIIRKADHIRELESLIMRIADPKGNATTGRLKRAVNLRARLKSGIRKAQKEVLIDVFGGREKSRPRLLREKHHGVRKHGRSATLAPYVKRGFPIKVTYKGTTYFARVRKDGRISFRGGLYTSPSIASGAITKRAFNGWTFWRYRSSEGKWVALSELRKR